jgi:hypothetical protein
MQRNGTPGVTATPVVATETDVARRVVAVVLVAAGVAACGLSLLQVAGGPLGQVRLVVTVGFLLLGPGWAVAGFLRRAPAAHAWLLAIGVGVATSLLVGQVMVMTGFWVPAGALFAATVLSVPFLVRHAVSAR